MKPSQLLCAKSSTEGVIIIEGQGSNHRVRIVGSSVAKFIANEDYSNSVTLSIKKGDKGFIAIMVLISNGKNNKEVFDFFLRIGWGEDGERPLIDLDSQWVPKSPERLGVIDNLGIRTEIDEIVFTSNKYDSFFAKFANFRYISDHNLICRYLAGDIEADVLEKASAEYVEEKSAKEKISELEKRIQELTALVAEKEKLLVEKEEAFKKEVVEYIKEGRMDYRRIIAAAQVIKAVKKQWFHRRSIKETLRKYEEVETIRR